MGMAIRRKEIKTNEKERDGVATIIYYGKLWKTKKRI